ncbi:hypothetical protein WG66_000668 [Moniliophthora roreri]|nr:hypothetical protein WG66_000668 [Moniliophthora roreri]
MSFRSDFCLSEQSLYLVCLSHIVYLPVSTSGWLYLSRLFTAFPFLVSTHQQRPRCQSFQGQNMLLLLLSPLTMHAWSYLELLVH